MTPAIKELAAKSTSANSLSTPAALPASPPASPPSPPRKPRRLLCLKEVVFRVGVSRAGIYRLVARARVGDEAHFPLPVQIGPGRIGWHEHEIDAWIESLPRAGDKDHDVRK